MNFEHALLLFGCPNDHSRFLSLLERKLAVQGTRTRDSHKYTKCNIYTFKINIRVALIVVKLRQAVSLSAPHHFIVTAPHRTDAVATNSKRTGA